MLGPQVGVVAGHGQGARRAGEHPLWNGGWIKVNTAECSREAVGAALRAGNFFSSRGPDFVSLTASGRRVTVETSPVRFIRLVGPAWNGLRWRADGARPLTGITLDVPDNWPYAYIEIEDDGGRLAWSNTLFTD